MKGKKLVFASACLGMLLFGVALTSLGSVAPGLREKFVLDEIAAGTLFSILPLGILGGSLLFGPIVDRNGYRLLLSASCIILAAGFEGLAFAPAAWMLRIFILLIGLGGGAINGATNALVADISENDKGANLSLLGVFFGLGALGMPLILGILEEKFSFAIIVASVGILSAAVGILFLLLKLPPPKLVQGIPLKKGVTFLRDDVLLVIALFLFLQSSFEGIINNWTTTFMIDYMAAPASSALFSLSLFVAGMTLMRLLTGSFLRGIPVKRILAASFVLIITGLILIMAGSPLALAMTGFMVLGAGLAGGFPIMLGFVGARYAGLSGTAFSFVLVIALIGNMVINYLMGIISDRFGTRHLLTVAFAEAVLMIILWQIIKRKIATTN